MDEQSGESKEEEVMGESSDSQCCSGGHTNTQKLPIYARSNTRFLGLSRVYPLISI